MPLRTTRTVRPVLATLALATSAVLLVGCSSNSANRRTVTEIVTAPSSAAATSGASPTGSSVVVTVPSETAASSGPASSGGSATSAPSSGASVTSGSSGAPSSASSSAPATTTGATATGGPIQKVDPLTIDCTRILIPGDVQRILGKQISAATTRTRFGAQANISATGAVRCAYGVVAGKQKASIRVTQYSSTAAAEKQVGVTVASEKDLGARISTATVGGQQAQVMLRSGGLVNVRYGTWVLAVAAVDGMLSGDQAAQMTALTDLVLKRILSSAN